ncbi:MAG: TetR/AcrR family transcriptional regulator [Pseudomonadales bacterium]|nr:TetR/AcrR family transcriptional regulator [Pseudomonadales bacterium]
MKTRDRILIASLKLFNQKGERNVSTNHIAAAMDISPGNLYYHFRNKQEIVFELFQQYTAEVSAFLSVPADRALTFADKIQYYEAIFKSIWDYRFLHRDMAHLMESCERLREGYQAFTRQTLVQGKDVLSGLRDAGLMDLSDELLDALMINIWVLVTSWSSFLLAISHSRNDENTLSESKMKRGIYQLITLTEPYATPDNEEALQRLKRDYLVGDSSDPYALF